MQGRYGVTTGADRAFIAPLDTLDVESDRKLPLVTTRDIRGGTVVWQGLGIINSFADQDGLVCLDEHPRLKLLFLEQFATALGCCARLRHSVKVRGRFFGKVEANHGQQFQHQNCRHHRCR